MLVQRTLIKPNTRLHVLQVAWLQSDADSGTLLSVHEQVIAKDSRIRVSQSSLRNWRLHIREVTESDRGFYMCQINTQPMISQMGYLDVLGSYTFICSL